MDGAQLVAGDSEPTVAMSPPQSTVTTVQPRKKRGLWVGLILVGIVLIGVLIAVLMYAAYRMGSESAGTKININGSSNPKTVATPRSAPETTRTAVPAQSPESSTTDTDLSDEATPITWTTAASTFKTDVGLKYTFECPRDGTASTVWGSDVYTADSSICTAGVHAGKITMERGGTVTIEFVGGRTTYGATTRNGVTTLNFGQYPRSYVFRDAAGKTD